MHNNRTLYSMNEITKSEVLQRQREWALKVQAKFDELLIEPILDRMLEIVREYERDYKIRGISVPSKGINPPRDKVPTS